MNHTAFSRYAITSEVSGGKVYFRDWAGARIVTAPRPEEAQTFATQSYAAAVMRELDLPKNWCVRPVRVRF